MNILRSLTVVLMASLLATSAAAQTADPADDTKQREPVDVFQDAGILVFETPDQQCKWWLDGLVGRHSTMDLNDIDASVRGGKEEIFTAGFNWYANANIRLMTNVLTVSNDEFAKGDRNYITGDRFNILQVRLQLNF